MKTLLHVGCGRGKLPRGYETYAECRLDCDPGCEPDVLASLVAMPMVGDETFDRVFASHVVEHLHAHEAALALAECHRVLKPGGVLEVFVPDLQAVGGRVALDQLCEPVYQSAMGPVTPLDMLYGHQASVAKGESFMAHKTGFTASVLRAALRRAGFEKVLIDRSGGALELKGTAIKGELCPPEAKPSAATSTCISDTPGSRNMDLTREASCPPA